MTTQTLDSGTARHVVRDVVVLVLSVGLTAGAMAALSLVVGQWA